MAEEVTERQLGFADITSNVATQEKDETPNISRETKKMGIIPVDEGAGLFTGASGEARTYMARVPEGATGKIIRTKTIRGVTSAYIEFESPPELQNHSFWVERRRKGPGFV